MKKLVLLAVVSFTMSLYAAEGPAKSVKSSIDIELGGFIKVDAAYDDSETNAGNYGMYVKEEDSSTSNSKNDDEFNLTPKQSRFWLKLHGPTYNGIKTGGKVEVDFYGAGGSENKASIMLRHAYFTLGWEKYGLTVLAGQTADVFSPLVPSTINYTVAWNQGNIGYRRPQIRITKKCTAGQVDVVTTAAICRTIGGESLTGVNSDYGEQSGFPTFEGRMGVGIPWINGSKLKTGFSGHYGKEQAETTTWQKNIETYSLNADLKMPLSCGFELSGEWFYGSNLDNYFGGIGQGINITEKKKIRAMGGWSQVAYTGIKNWKFAVGGGVDNPYDGDLETGAREYNELIFSNVTYLLTKNVILGAGYSHLRTDYKNGRIGQDNRIQFSAIYRF